MAFSLDQFYKINRRALIWVILFGLLWILRDFFGLIFVTFLLTFFATVLIRRIEKYVPIARRAVVVLVYGILMLAFATFVRFAIPEVSSQAWKFFNQIGQMEKNLTSAKTSAVRKYPFLNTLFNEIIRSDLSEEALTASGITAREQKIFAMKESRDAQLAILGGHSPEQVLARVSDYTTSETSAAKECRSLEKQIALTQGEQDEALLRAFLNKQAIQIGQQIPRLVKALGAITTGLLMAILFSFLISLDIGRLGREIQSLRSSRLRDFYEEAAQPVVRFCYVLGRAFQAQATIGCVNTFLTLIGLLILGIPSIALLSLTVFLCSFIPVLGVFISTIPIVLVAINTGGLSLGIWAVMMIIVIHIIEAYILNPMIYGHHMQLNPVLVLMILFVGHHLFPLWGMLLGVPVTYYVLHDVFGVPVLQIEPKGGQKSGPG
ncbi:AI-2E family transporter [bacterium]|nr:AI-2E family transporter [bacterium]